MSEINSSNFKKEHGDLAPDLVGVTELTSPYFFVPPSGNTGERPENCEPGTLRFNTDHGSLEVYRGDTIGWEHIERREGQYLGGALGPTYAGSNTGTGTRALSMGGQVFPADINKIDFVTIPTLGDAQDFGDLSETRTQSGGLGSRVRGFCCGGLDSPSNYRNTIDSHEFDSTGTFIDFGNLTATARLLAAFSSSTRGVTAGGNPRNDVIDYFTMATTGNALDFGDLNHISMNGAAVCASNTRAIAGGGFDGGIQPELDYVQIMTLGNAKDFGDLDQARSQPGAVSNAHGGLAG